LSDLAVVADRGKEHERDVMRACRAGKFRVFGDECFHIIETTEHGGGANIQRRALTEQEFGNGAVADVRRRLNGCFDPGGIPAS
jgi:hypothetical protein